MNLPEYLASKRPDNLVVIYVCDALPAFRQPARASAEARFIGRRIVERNPVWFDKPEHGMCAVFVESRWAQVVTEYQALGVPVFTEYDLSAPTPEPEPVLADPEFPAVPIRRGRGRPRKHVVPPATDAADQSG